MPPCERSGTVRPERSCLAAALPIAVLRSETTITSPRRSSGSSNFLQPVARSSASSMPGSPAMRLMRSPLFGIVRQIDRGEGAERAVMHDIGIGDRQDHPRLAGADPAVEHVLQIDHVRRAVGLVLVVHAVIGGEDDGRALGIQLRQVAVHHAIEAVGVGRAGRRLVLHIVGGREIHDVRPAFLQQLHARGEHELAEVRAVDRGQRPADIGQRIVDAVLGHRGLVRPSRRRSRCRSCPCRAACAACPWR